MKDVAFTVPDTAGTPENEQPVTVDCGSLAKPAGGSLPGGVQRVVEHLARNFAVI